MKEYLKKFVEKEKEFEEVKKEVLKFVEKYYDDVLFYKELVDNECDKLMVLLMFVRINMMFVFIGWVLRLDVQKIFEGIKRIMEGKVYINVCELRKEEFEEMFVKFKNLGWVRFFEMFIEMYGVFRYDEIDLMLIIVFIYLFFFGFMFIDFFYGLIVGIVVVFLVKGYKKFNDGIYKFVYILFWSVFFMMFFGVFFGSYFGNVVDIMF